MKLVLQKLESNFKYTSAYYHTWPT